MEILVFSVAAGDDDVLTVSGSVNGVLVTARGWASWTKKFWDDDPENQREMNQEELRKYTEQLLMEAAQVTSAPEKHGLHVDPLLDDQPSDSDQPENEI